MCNDPVLTLGWWAADAWATGPMFLISWVFWVIAAITLHELAHGWAALACGDDTPRLSGHMTINPLVHMGTMSLVLFALAGIAWGAMPVNPSKFRGRLDEAFVSFAGPAMNAVLAIVCVVTLAVWVRFSGFGVKEPLAENVLWFLTLGGMLNISLFLLNLLPIPPLDGSRIVGNFSRRFREWAFSPGGLMTGTLLFIPVCFFGGRFLFPVASELFMAAVVNLSRLLGAA